MSRLISAAMAPPIQISTGQRALMDELMRLASSAPETQLADATGMTRYAAAHLLEALEEKDLVHREGQKRTTRWSLTTQGRNYLAAASKADAPSTELTPGISTPAALPIDADISTAAPAARETYTAVTEPAGPRDGPSSSIDPAPTLDETLGWHEAAAQHEARRRAALQIGALPLPEAMCNAGLWEPEALSKPGATSVLVDDAKFAIWSDGRCEIDAGVLHLTLSEEVTQRLFSFVGQFIAIDPL